MNAPTARRSIRAALSAVAVTVVAVTCLAPVGLTSAASSDSGSSGEVVSATKEWKTTTTRTKEW